MIEGLFAYDDDKKDVVAIGTISGTSVKYIIYLDGKIKMWSDDYD